MFKEFKEFIARGNVLDMAIGIIMGSAFTAIVTSMVDDILMPVISGLTAGIDYQDIVFNVGGASLKVGNFINAIISFLIIAFVMFLIVKGLNSLHKEEKEEEVTEKECPYCKSSIPVEASRCPHCTSKLDNYKNANE